MGIGAYVDSNGDYSPEPKGSNISELSYYDGRFTPGDGNYRGRRFEIREEGVWEE